jgi:hypothetical protein
MVRAGFVVHDGAMRALALACAIGLGAACSAGAPSATPAGPPWEVPLISPLEDVPLLVPVEIHGTGPHVFRIDPDAPRSVIDDELVRHLGLATRDGLDYLDEAGARRATRFADVRRLAIGTMTARDQTMVIARSGALAVAGHDVRGVIGRDVLTDAVAVGFDRRRGLLWITARGAFAPPADAIAIRYRRVSSVVPAPIPAEPRRVVDATIAGQPVAMHLDLGAYHSQLRATLVAALGLDEVPIARAVVDEVGTRTEVERGAVAPSVAVGGVDADHVLVLPYQDQRWDAQAIDGAIGLDVLAGHTVWIDFATDTVHVAPGPDRDLVADRIRRWGSDRIAGCASPGCARIDVLTPNHDGARPVVTIERDPATVQYAVELLLEARTAAGAPTGAPRIVAVLPVGVTRWTQLYDARYAGATLAVLDVSPLPRPCRQDRGCLYMTGSP